MNLLSILQEPKSVSEQMLINWLIADLAVLMALQPSPFLKSLVKKVLMFEGFGDKGFIVLCVANFNHLFKYTVYVVQVDFRHAAIIM